MIWGCRGGRGGKFQERLSCRGGAPSLPETYADYGGGVTPGARSLPGGEGTLNAPPPISSRSLGPYRLESSTKVTLEGGGGKHNFMFWPERQLVFGEFFGTEQVRPVFKPGGSKGPQYPRAG